MTVTHFYIILLTLIANLGWEFYKSFVIESGKNKALLRDIEKLTKIAEKIKNDLQVESQIKLATHTDVKAMAIDAYEKYAYWVQKSRSALHSALIASREDMLEQRKETGEAFEKFFTVYKRLDLYLVDSEIIDLWNDVWTRCDELNDEIQETITMCVLGSFQADNIRRQIEELERDKSDPVKLESQKTLHENLRKVNKDRYMATRKIVNSTYDEELNEKHKLLKKKVNQLITGAV